MKLKSRFLLQKMAMRYGMSMEIFEKSIFLNNLYDKLAIAEANLKAGRVSDVDDAISDIREKYDL